MSDIDYPNREHANADKAARRRAFQALADIEREVTFLRRRIEGDVADGDDTSTLNQRAADITRHMSVLESFRDVREWHAADQAEEAASRG